MAHAALIDAYKAFIDKAHPLMHITSEEDYDQALETLEEILESANDTEDDPLNPLIDMLSHAIEKYESQDEELMAFVNQAEEMPADIALLRTLMAQHNLTGSDLPEIGTKSMVSKVLKGERELNRTAIEKLCLRFDLQPAWFFD